MEQASMHFYDDEYEALGVDILAAGGYKKIAFELWPHIKRETAYSRLKAVIENKNGSKLALGELTYILQEARKAKSCAYVTYLSDKCDLTRPHFRDPDDEKILLQKAVVEAVKHLDTLTHRLEGLEK